MAQYVISSENREKTRSFVAHLIAAVTRGVVSTTSGNTVRPVWAVWAESEQQLRPFMANLRLGLKAEEFSSYSRSSTKFEFLRSAPFKTTWQREAEGSLATIFLPEYFSLDPGMSDVQGIDFAMLVPDWWIAGQQELKLSEDDLDYLRKYCRFDVDAEQALPNLAQVAGLFHLYLDRRTRCPMVQDLRFSAQLLLEAFHNEMAALPTNNLTYFYSSLWGHSRNHMFGAQGLEDVGISTAISFMATHEVFEEFLAEQTKLYFSRT